MRFMIPSTNAKELIDTLILLRYPDTPIESIQPRHLVQDTISIFEYAKHPDLQLGYPPSDIPYMDNSYWEHLVELARSAITEALSGVRVLPNYTNRYELLDINGTLAITIEDRLQ